MKKYNKKRETCMKKTNKPEKILKDGKDKDLLLMINKCMMSS